MSMLFPIVNKLKRCFHPTNVTLLYPPLALSLSMALATKKKIVLVHLLAPSKYELFQ